MAVIEKTTQAKTAATTGATLTKNKATVGRVADVHPAPAPTTTKTPEPSVDHGADNRLRLVYTVLLGAAACLALMGVVLQNEPVDAGSPDAPPPAVLEQGS